MTAEDLVLHGRRGEVIGEERTALILDPMDDPTGGPSGAEGADRPAECRPEIETVWAGTVTFEDTFEGMAAGQAAWIADPGEQGDSGG